MIYDCDFHRNFCYKPSCSAPKGSYCMLYFVLYENILKQIVVDNCFMKKTFTAQIFDVNIMSTSLSNERRGIIVALPLSKTIKCFVITIPSPHPIQQSAISHAPCQNGNLKSMYTVAHTVLTTIPKTIYHTIIHLVIRTCLVSVCVFSHFTPTATSI